MERNDKFCSQRILNVSFTRERGRHVSILCNIVSCIQKENYTASKCTYILCPTLVINSVLLQLFMCSW